MPSTSASTSRSLRSSYSVASTDLTAPNPWRVNSILTSINNRIAVLEGETATSVSTSSSTVTGVPPITVTNNAVALAITGPFYVNEVKELAMNLSTDFVIVGGQLQQSAVNLAKAYGFNTTNFSVTSGSFVVDSIGVNTLIAGNTFNLGTSIFAQSATGPWMGLTGGIIAMADNYTTPANTITIAATTSSWTPPSGGSTIHYQAGMTIMNWTSTSSVQITTVGAAFYSITSTSTGAGNIAYPYVAITATGGVTVSGGTSTTQVSITSTQIKMTSGSTTMITLSGTTGAITACTLQLVANGLTTTINNQTWNGYAVGLIADDGSYNTFVNSQIIGMYDDSGHANVQITSAGAPSIALTTPNSGNPYSVTWAPVFLAGNITSPAGTWTVPSYAQLFVQIKFENNGGGLKTGYIPVY